ncbi:hypothetical protein TRFO_37973 [Tritrichomonas foetus]|uniref:Uncharacterized protein n=1 Tax=Tritrichomonas foetus TaxID=1144522 RepID=A0A1J4J9P8_9EUKA|nr:hypothetical protein TRFO_37973 [Tritrichomonas foetus]|eukprot:OHS95922.1 hypothetical protein TRFO_37973 [Tritrichomonas foetus]
MDYVIWIISKFNESKKFSPYPFREIPKIELTGIGVPFYKNHAYCLPDESFETLNEKFTSIPETLSKIIQSQDEKSSFFRLIENVLLSIPDRKSYISNENIQQDNEVLDSEKNNMKSHFFTLLSFILELINHFNTETVYDLIFADLNHFKESWAPKIIDYLYPADKSYVNQALQDLFGILFYKCYLHLENKRKFLLDELSFVIDSRTTQTYLQTKPYMDQFLPLLNTILIKTDTKFGSIVVSSQLFKTLIRESKIDVRVFDLFSTIIYAYPIECFTTSLLTSFFIETYDHDLFYNSIVRCLANGLHNLCQVKDQNESRYLFNHFISILPALFSKRSERCHDLIDMLTRTVLSFENSMFIIFFSSGILEVITRQCISLKTETMLRSTFRLFTAISQQTPKNLKLMSNPKAPIFNLFSEFFTRNAFDFEIVDALFEFAIVPSPDMTKNKSFDYKDYSSDHYFRNPMAVSLIFYWIQGRKNESEIIQLLIVMTDRHSVNAYQLQKAHVPLMILTRLKKVSNDNNLAQDYCDLLYTIWRQGAPVSDIFRAISIMKTIDSPHLIIDNFNRLLRQEKKNHAVSFWFDGKDSGFSGPKFDFEKTFDTLCISLSFYSDYLPINDTYPLLFFKNEKADRIEFGLTQNNIYFSLNDKGQQLFKTCFLKGVWYNVAFIINPKGIKLIVDNSKGSLQIKRNVYRDSIFRKVVDSNRALTDPEVFTANFQITQSIKMFIGRKSNHTAFFKGLIGTVYVFNEYIPNEDYAHIDPLTISSALKEHLIGIYNPRINIENNKYYLNDHQHSLVLLLHLKLLMYPMLSYHSLKNLLKLVNQQ